MSRSVHCVCASPLPVLPTTPQAHLIVCVSFSSPRPLQRRKTAAVSVQSSLHTAAESDRRCSRPTVDEQAIQPPMVRSPMRVCFRSFSSAANASRLSLWIFRTAMMFSTFTCREARTRTRATTLASGCRPTFLREY